MTIHGVLVDPLVVSLDSHTSVLNNSDIDMLHKGWWHAIQLSLSEWSSVMTTVHNARKVRSAYIHRRCVVVAMQDAWRLRHHIVGIECKQYRWLSTIPAAVSRRMHARAIVSDSGRGKNNLLSIVAVLCRFLCWSILRSTYTQMKGPVHVSNLTASPG